VGEIVAPAVLLVIANSNYNKRKNSKLPRSKRLVITPLRVSYRDLAKNCRLEAGRLPNLRRGLLTMAALYIRTAKAIEDASGERNRGKSSGNKAKKTMLPEKHFCPDYTESVSPRALGDYLSEVLAVPTNILL
jgi:hypothetical protein